MKTLTPALLICALLSGCDSAQPKAVTASLASFASFAAPATTAPTFKMRLEAFGMPTSVSPSDLVMALACCDSNGDCVWVDLFGQCSFPDEVFYCNSGQSNPDGSITCWN